MSRVAWLAAYLAAVFIGGALMAPGIWWAVQSAAASAGAPGWVHYLAGHPFHRYVQRCLLVIAIAGLWVLGRRLGLRTWADLGLRDGAGWRRWGAGLALGAAMFGVTLAVEMGFGTRGWRAEVSPERIARAAGAAVVAAWVVGWLEEAVYRGVLCGGLRRSVGWGWAAVISATIYAWLHFLGKPPTPVEVGWDAGLGVVAGMLRGLVAWPSLVPGLPTLFVAGLILAAMYRRTGSLYFSAGLHSGWIFWIKLRSALTGRPSGSVGGQGESGVSAGWAGFWAVATLGAAMAWMEWHGRRGGRGGAGAKVGERKSGTQ